MFTITLNALFGFQPVQHSLPPFCSQRHSFCLNSIQKGLCILRQTMNSLIKPHVIAF